MIKLYDNNGKEHVFWCEQWEYEKERYVFYDRGKIVAVFQANSIIGFKVER